MTTRSVRTQLLLGIAGVVMLTILLFAAAAWRFVLLPAEDDHRRVLAVVTYLRQS